MAWNGSDNGKVETRGGAKTDRLRSATSSSHFNSKALLAGLVVVVLGGLAAWLILGRARTPSAPQGKGTARPKPIKAVTPAAASTNRGPSKAELELKHRREFCATNKSGRIVRYEEVTVDKDGKRWFMGQPVPDNKPGEMYQDGKRIGWVDHFKTPGENFLAAQVLGEAGLPSCAPRELPPSVIRNIKEHLKDPIEIGPDDEPKVVQLKKDMIDLKAEMADRIDKGETLESILEGVQKDLDYYCNMRSGYEDGLKTLEASGATDDEIKDYVEAANRILGENGVVKIKLPGSIRRKMLLEKVAARKKGTRE